jgi:hypothetical protein
MLISDLGAKMLHYITVLMETLTNLHTYIKKNTLHLVLLAETTDSKPHR